MSVRRDDASKGELSAAISSAVVKLMRDYIGRGPTKARTYIEGNLISVVLEDTLTMAERSLVRDGRGDLVVQTRRTFQQTMAAELVALIEEQSGRVVRAFLSDHHLDPDIAIESFVLQPRQDGEFAPDGQGAGEDLLGDGEDPGDPGFDVPAPSPAPAA